MRTVHPSQPRDGACDPSILDCKKIISALSLEEISPAAPTCLACCAVMNIWPSCGNLLGERDRASVWSLGFRVGGSEFRVEGCVLRD